MKFNVTEIKAALIKLALAILVLVSYTNCCSAKRLQAEAPTTFGEVYYKNWVAGVEGGGSGTNVFIEVTSNTVVLDSVYFQEKISKLETKPNNPLLYIGRFFTEAKTQNDLQLNQEGTAEAMGAGENASSFPFKLQDDECVVSYKVNGKRKYFKLTGIIQKPSEEYPSVKNSEMDQNLN